MKLIALYISQYFQKLIIIIIKPVKKMFLFKKQTKLYKKSQQILQSSKNNSKLNHILNDFWFHKISCINLVISIIFKYMGSSALEKADKIPTGLDKKDKLERQKIFRLFDVNGNQYLSLAQIDKGMRDVLNLPELFDAKPVLIRAYQASKDKVTAKHSFGDDYVSKAEFRYLLIYLKLYYNLWIQFQRLDVGDERKLNEAEFINGVPYYKSWGIKLKDPKKTFSELKAKSNAVQSITFTTFSNWIIHKHLELYPNSDIHEDLD